MKFSVVIATYNRADELARTLESLSTLQVAEPWEVIIVDNNSADNTKEVVLKAAETFPVPLHYLHETQQGRSAALNTGIKAAQGEIIATTDDDVRLEPDWLTNAERALRELHCDYLGGKALPIWSGKRPAWIPEGRSIHWAVIALLDYGPKPLPLVDYVAIGVNMIFRREAFDRAGLWDNTIGRKAGTLLGQEVREWCQRARAADLKGFYSPDLVVHHVIPADRLTKKYFRRWFYWHGISRAILYQTKGLDMESPESTELDFSTVPHVAGIPRYMFRTYLQSFFSMISAFLRGDAVAAFEQELGLWFFAGVIKERWKDRRRPVPARASLATVQDINRS
ncbi:MAG TPA: glycosyltransferase family 2 protein [Pyrinomonadaceae bacterium]|nr:glycosyltransferase family 2 protein [Pyrinomonadaceae bacterium]